MASARKHYLTYFLGDACLCWSLGNTIARLTSLQVLYVYRRLKANKELSGLGVRDLVPSYTALAVHADTLSDWQEVRRVVNRCFDSLPVTEAELLERTVRHILPVSYHGEDLPRIAKLHGLAIEEVIKRHTAVDYMVAMIGFRPHFPYLLGLDQSLFTPRLDTPRLKVPAGAVAIGGEQTGVYPQVSPGGWNILGLTDPQLLPAINPGDTIVFQRVIS